MNTELRVKLASFEGPLDLLLYLIQKDEIDIRSIKIAEITDQYLRTLDLMREHNLDVAGDFLLMASTLIYIKSRTMLPQTDELLVGEGDDILTQDELMRRLMEHQRYRAMAMDFKGMPVLGKDFFKRPLPDEREKREQLLKEMNLTDLTLAFQNLLMKSRSPTVKVKADRLSIAEAARRIADKLGSQEVTDFQSLFSENPDRNELVVTFLAILELGRLQKIRVLQHVVYGTIYVVLRDKLNLETMQKLFESGDSYAYQRPAEQSAQ
ncbi:MAG TPA: segregation/condensation protein A [Bdellovibrionota bacterium]|jgi:segregation and condensation protein A